MTQAKTCAPSEDSGQYVHKPSKNKVFVCIHHVHRVAIKDIDMYPDSIQSGPLSTRQLNVIWLAFCWWVDGGSRLGSFFMRSDWLPWMTWALTGCPCLCNRFVVHWLTIVCELASVFSWWAA